MNGGNSRINVPPIHLAGLTSLTQILSEMPLPQPMTDRFGAKQSLLFHPRVAEEANRLISLYPDPQLISVLTSAISKTNTDHIVLKDKYNKPETLDDNDNIPELLKAILHHNPNVFDGAKSFIQQQVISPRAPNSNIQQSSATPQTPASAMSDASSVDEDVPPHLRHLLRHEQPFVALEHLPSPNQSSSSAFSHPNLLQPELLANSLKSTSKPSKLEQDAMRKRIVSIGKQPKAQSSSASSSSRKKKDMVSELFDSLTPAAEYFSEKPRRRRAAPKTYSEDEYVKSAAVVKSNDEDSLDIPQHHDVSTHSFMPSTKTKRKHDKSSEDKDFDGADAEPERPVTPTEVIREREHEWQEMMKRRKEKFKRRSVKYIDPKELVELESYRKFCYAIDCVFDNVEDCDLTAEAGAEDEDEVPAECLIPKNILNELCSESNKLKAMGVLNRVPIDRLTKLITVLERNIRDGGRLLPILDEKFEGEEDATWRELMADRVFRSADAALCALTIMTSVGMPKQVYIDDAIERSVLLVKFQLQNVIFPAYDPVYRTEKEKKSRPDNENDSSISAKGKRNKSSGGAVKNRTVLMLYGKIVELIGSLADLVTIQPLTDTTVLHLCTLGINPFFVENISELQLNALRLVSNVFNKYETHRKLILEEILASLARLPSSKRGKRSYRLNADDFIQMISALVMQLVQSVVNVPSTKAIADEYDEEDARLKILDEQQAKQRAAKQRTPKEADVVVLSSYDQAMATAHMFLSAYLKKCTTKSEEDYRPLFEAFVEDILTAVHKPEWPAAELLLSLLGKLLMQHFSNKQIDMSLRVASLDYLGVVAARLRKDTVASQFDENTLNEIILAIGADIEDEISESMLRKQKKNKGKVELLSENSMQILQRALVDYLVLQKENDPSIEYSRQFYVAQWYKDTTTELERIIKTPQHAAKRSKKDISDDDEADDIGSRTAAEQEKAKCALQNATATKQFLLTLVDRDTEEFYGSKLHRDGPVLKESQAAFIVRWLASKRPLSQSFEIYLSQILRVLHDPSVPVRTKAMKGLSAVVEADPSILARPDVCAAVNARLSDTSSSVREAAIDLIGKFITAKPELLNQYYSMLMNRILDTGVSVRKRVIKILKDICERRPEYEKNAEISMRILRRVNDEESVKKLVCETFHGLWFTPVREKDTAKLLKKVVTITDVIGACSKEGGQYDGFESLLTILLKKENDKNALQAAKQVVNCLVENVLTLEEKLNDNDPSGATTSHHRMLCCLTTLYLFAKIKPTLMVDHAETMQPYLSMNCTTPIEQAVLVQVIKILEMVIPLMDHPSEKFLGQVEDILLKLLIKSPQNVVQASASCLAAIINRLTKNWQKAMLAYQKMFSVLLKLKSDHEICPDKFPSQAKPSLLRALFTIGLLCQHFDFDSYVAADKKPDVSWKDRVFNTFMYFATVSDEDVRFKAFAALGLFCINHSSYLMRDDLKALFHRFLVNPSSDVRLKIQVLRNIESFLREEEAKMTKSYDEWDSAKRREDLKEMGEISSGLGSSVIQHYLREVLFCYFHPDVSVRSAASCVVGLTLQQGLVHPVQCIPYLIAMSTDDDTCIKNKAENILKEVDSKYTGFIQMKASEGIKLSYKVQKLLITSSATSSKIRVARGLKFAPTSEAMNAYVYTLLRGVRQQRRGFLKNLLQMFDEISNICLDELIFVADNLACFPYQTLDEPLFVMHSIDLTVSVAGASLLQTFRDNLLPKTSNVERQVTENQDVAKSEYDDDDDELTADDVYARLPLDTKVIKDCVTASQGCVLLLMLKQYLKEIFGITDSKIQEYSPSEPAKVYDKAVTRRSAAQPFNPKFALDYVQLLKNGCPDVDDERRKLSRQYVDFRQLMMSVDTVTAASDEDSHGGTAAGGATAVETQSAYNAANVVAFNQMPLMEQPVISLTRLEENMFNKTA